jgi:hypothetical protein
MKTHRAVVAAIVPALLMFAPLSRIMAQEAPPAPVEDQAPTADPPGRVARLNYASGSVSFQPGGEGDWVQAVANRPLSTGDNLWADKGSRAEVHIGSTAIRLDAETSLTFLDLDDHTTQLKLSMGSVILRVRHLDDGDFVEVDTPTLAFAIQSTGEYRIDVNSDGSQTDTTVWQGRGEVTGGGSSYLVVAGQLARFRGSDQLDHEIDQLPGSDDFDTWTFGRDQREDRSESANYISTEMTGYEDLDDYGRWHYVAGYGPVWTPAGIAADWAPYRFGHWAWVEPWGWTWVEDEPWGFAPFHYGRWAFVTGTWCWVPGRAFVRPVYAPALVAFVGGGGFNLSLSVGGPGVAWFPLGPGEVYVPWYRVSRGYVNNVNITNTRVNITQVTNVYNVYNSRTTNVASGARISYVNQRVSNAVTAVSRETFVNARPVARNFARVNEKQMEAAPVTHQPDLQPVRSSVLGAGAPARVRPPVAVVNRQVIATRNPTPPLAPFEQRQAARNVRTETPATPQSAARTPSLPPRAPESIRTQPLPQARMPQAIPQPLSNARPQQPAPAQPGLRPNPQSMSEPAIPRPLAATPDHRSFESSHPLVRSAPPVEDKPEMQRSEEQKFSRWQQQRPMPSPPPQASRPAESRAPQPRSDDRERPRR